jgi:hypothetical protein
MPNSAQDPKAQATGEPQPDPSKGTPNPDTSQQQTTEPENFTDFIKAQPEKIQLLFESHEKGLKNTVEATRKERDDLSKQLRDAAKNVEKGSKLEAQLQELAGKLDNANARATFYEMAPLMECRNPKAAFAIMAELDLKTRSGEPDWKSIKEAAPELFGKAGATANAGAGTQQQTLKSDPHTVINDFIRGKGKAP